MAAIYVGGCVRALVERRRRDQPKQESDPALLAASGLVAGEGLAGVLVAALVASELADKSGAPRLSGLPGELAVLLLVLLVAVFLTRAGRSRPAAAPTR
jgi:hypothetical protein